VKKRETKRLWQVIRKEVKKKQKIKEKKSEMFVRAGTCFGYFLKQFNEGNPENQVGETEKTGLRYFEKSDNFLH
jgi:hypothetical protein